MMHSASSIAWMAESPTHFLLPPTQLTQDRGSGGWADTDDSRSKVRAATVDDGMVLCDYMSKCRLRAMIVCSRFAPASSLETISTEQDSRGEERMREGEEERGEEGEL